MIDYCHACNGHGGHYDREVPDQWYWCEQCDAGEKYYEKRKKLNTMSNIRVGDLVEFKGKDSYFKGHIVCIFTKLNGESVRCCVENSDGLLLIKNPRDAELI